MTQDERVYLYARYLDYCPGCGEPKSLSDIHSWTPMCWNCFKYRKDVTPFKWASARMTLNAWLLSIGRPELTIPEDWDESVAMESLVVFCKANPRPEWPPIEKERKTA